MQLCVPHAKLLTLLRVTVNWVPRRRHCSVFNNVAAGWLPCSLLKELYGGQHWRGGGGFPQQTDPGGRGALRQATAQQLLCAQWPLLFSRHRRWWQQQQVPIGWSPSHHRQKSHLVGALCPLSATNIHNAVDSYDVIQWKSSRQSSG